MKSNKLAYDSLMSFQKQWVRALLAFAEGNPREEIVEVVILTRPFDQELLRPLLEAPIIDVGGQCPDDPKGLRRSHPASRAFRDDFSGLPPEYPPRAVRHSLDPDREQ